MAKEFEDTKGAIRNRISKQNRQHNDQKKKYTRTNNDQPSHGGDRKIFEMMTSTLPKGILDSVASSLAATLHQGYPDRTTSFGISYHLRDKYSICRCCRNIATYKCKVHNGKIEIIYLVVEFLNRPSMSISRCRSRYEQTYLYLNLWYPLFQAQCDRCDQQNHKTQNYLVKGHHLYSGTRN